MPHVIATHDRTSADYQHQWDGLVSQGYRPVSLSVYGSPADPRYAAVWVQRPGPAFAGIHGVGNAGFQQFFNTWAAKGYSPTIIAATGTDRAPVFAAVMELEGHGVSLTRYGLRAGADADNGTIEFWLAEARRRDWIPRWIAAYGTPQDRRYAIVLDPNRGHALWSVAGLYGEDAGSYQQRFDAQRQQWSRPAFVTLTPDGGYLSVFREDSVGDSWAARHGLTSAGYQGEVDTWMPQGFYPAYVQAGGPAANTRFAAFFARHDKPLVRSFRATGPAVASMRAIDDLVEERMRATGTRATAVAVTNHGRLVYARGFTWGEDDYPTTQPTSMFRVASCSKPITAIAIFQMVQQGRLSLDDHLADRVSTQLPPGATADTRFGDITIGQLLTHSAGWIDSNFGFSDLATAARAWNQTSLPVSKRRVAGYLAGQPMHYQPGTQQVYSNFGYAMLGLVVESLTGRSYTGAVRNTIMQPLGLTRPHRTPTPQSQQRPGSVRQHEGSLNVVPSAIAGPATGARPLAAAPYGGEDYSHFDSFGGWCMAPVDYAKLLAAFALGDLNPLLNRATVDAMWTVPPISPASAGFQRTHGWNSWREPNGVRGFEHGGALPGVATRILLRTDGWAYAIYANGHHVPDIYAAVAGLPASAWPMHDLFPQFGIPPHPLPAVTPATTTPVADHRPAHLRGEEANTLEPLRAA